MKKKRILYMVALGLIVIFLGLLYAMSKGYTSTIDDFGVRGFARTESLTGIMKVITTFGESWFLVLVSILFIIFVRDKKDGVVSIICLGGIAGINNILKNIVQRARPMFNQLVEVSGYSFPSGHSASAFGFYGFLIYLIYKRCENKALRNVSIVLLVALIIGIGVSRVYLGVHYISDVIGGFLLGGAYLSLYVNLSKTLWDN